MAKDGKKKVKSRASTKYVTSSDEDNSSDDEDNLLALFANLNMQQKEKLNELIGAIHEKDELLDSQEDFLIKENKSMLSVGVCSPVQDDTTGVCSDVNRVLARDGNSSINLASHGHCAGVFIGI
jgi:hypothetical protein